MELGGTNIPNTPSPKKKLEKEPLNANVVVRSIHLFSCGILFGLLTLNYFFTVFEYLKEESDFDTFLLITQFTTLLSGIFLYFTTRGPKPIEKEDHKPWQLMQEVKFFVTLLMTPAVAPLQSMLSLDEEQVIQL